MKVAVLMGGTSAEREISLRTGRGMAQALRKLGHEALAVDAASGKLLPAGEEEKAPAPQEALAPGAPSALVRADTLRDADVVLIALHGGAGENGTLQALLELAGKPYTGSGVLASALAMNKAMAKKLFEREGIATPAWVLAPLDGPLHALIRAGDIPPAIRNLRLPLIVKPNEEGSTFGLTIVRDGSALATAFQEASKYGPDVLLETYVAGRELTVAVLGDRALPIVEIRPKSGLYDFEAKYTAGKSEYSCPADLPEPLAREIRDLGLRAATALGCRGVSRVDFMLDDAGKPWCLEVNTIPGMTPLSLVPMAAKAAGISYEQVVQRMLDLALEEARRRHATVPTKA